MPIIIVNSNIGNQMTTTEAVKQKAKDIIESLKTQRDELSVKIHLANMEVREEWEIVEHKWEHLQSKGAQIKKEVGNSAHEIGDAISNLADEIKESYQRIRKAF